MTQPNPAVSPTLAAGQLASLSARGKRVSMSVGETLYAAGDRDYDFIVLESGEVDIWRPALPGSPEALIVTFEAGQFLGELSL